MVCDRFVYWAHLYTSLSLTLPLWSVRNSFHFHSSPFVCRYRRGFQSKNARIAADGRRFKRRIATSTHSGYAMSLGVVRWRCTADVSSDKLLESQSYPQKDAKSLRIVEIHDPQVMFTYLSIFLFSFHNCNGTGFWNWDELKIHEDSLWFFTLSHLTLAALACITAANLSTWPLSWSAFQTFFDCFDWCLTHRISINRPMSHVLEAHCDFQRVFCSEFPFCHLDVI